MQRHHPKPSNHCEPKSVSVGPNSQDVPYVRPHPTRTSQGLLLVCHRGLGLAYRWHVESERVSLVTTVLTRASAVAWRDMLGRRPRERETSAGMRSPAERGANRWRPGGSPELRVRPAEPGTCLPDVMPGLLPRPAVHGPRPGDAGRAARDRKSTRLNSSHRT